MEFTTLGALVGLVLAIVLIIKKVHPAYSLILGALVGGIVGGGGLTGTVDTMVSGAQSMMSSVLRILTSGILAGALIKTGSAEKIADVIVSKLGERFAIVSIAISTMIICAVGVFVDISVITVAPIAMAIGLKAGYNKPAILARHDRRRKSRKHYLAEPEHDCHSGGLPDRPYSPDDEKYFPGHRCCYRNNPAGIFPCKKEKWHTTVRHRT